MEVILVSVSTRHPRHKVGPTSSNIRYRLVFTSVRDVSLNPTRLHRSCRRRGSFNTTLVPPRVTTVDLPKRKLRKTTLRYIFEVIGIVNTLKETRRVFFTWDRHTSVSPPRTRNFTYPLVERRRSGPVHWGPIDKLENLRVKRVDFSSLSLRMENPDTSCCLFPLINSWVESCFTYDSFSIKTHRGRVKGERPQSYKECGNNSWPKSERIISICTGTGVFWCLKNFLVRYKLSRNIKVTNFFLSHPRLI